MTELDPYEYPIYPHAYLNRARSLLMEGNAHSIFYAAFELRCFLECRQDQYLEAQREYARSVPNRWKIGAQGKALAGIFKSEKIQYVAWYADDELIFDAYHIPVSDELRDRVEKLGTLLHSQKTWRDPDDEWWNETRKNLVETYELAWLCGQGMLLSPLFLHEGKTVGKFEISCDDDMREKIIANMKIGSKGIMKVDYPEVLPEDWNSDLVV